MPNLIESVHIKGSHPLVEGEIGRAADEVARAITGAEGRRTRTEARHNGYWLYVVPDCATTPRLQEPIPDFTRFPWREVRHAPYYCLSGDALQPPLQGRKSTLPYGEKT